jgi:hypothetical protein
MLQDAHTRKISIPVSVDVGTETVIAAVDGAWIYVHELIGDLGATGNLIVKSGSTTLASFALDGGQGITLQDEPGEDNRPRFECKPGDDFVLTVTGGTFTGACHYSLRY